MITQNSYRPPLRQKSLWSGLNSAALDKSTTDRKSGNQQNRGTIRQRLGLTGFSLTRTSSFFSQISTQSITVSHTLIKTRSVVHDQPLQTSNYTSPLSFLSVTPFSFKNKSCTAVSAFLNVMGIKPGACALCRLTRR